MNDTMDSISGTTRALHKFLTANPRQSPTYRPLGAAAVSDGSTYFAMALAQGGPSYGRIWDVRRISTWPGGATDPFAALAGVTVALVKFSGVVPNKGSATAPQFTDMIVAPQQVPNDVEFGNNECTVRPGEVLALLYKGTANTQALIAIGQAEEYLESQHQDITA